MGGNEGPCGFDPAVFETRKGVLESHSHVEFRRHFARRKERNEGLYINRERGIIRRTVEIARLYDVPGRSIIDMES